MNGYNGVFCTTKPAIPYSSSSTASYGSSSTGSWVVGVIVGVAVAVAAMLLAVAYWAVRRHRSQKAVTISRSEDSDKKPVLRMKEEKKKSKWLGAGGRASSPFDWQGIDDSPDHSNIPLTVFGDFSTSLEGPDYQQPQILIPGLTSSSAVQAPGASSAIVTNSQGHGELDIMELKPIRHVSASGYILNNVNNLTTQLKYFDEQLADSLEGPKCLQEFQKLSKARGSATYQAATSETNRNSNRYKNIFPYDDTRVRLSHSGQGDYINASHIAKKIGTTQYWYIATQGPLPSTLVDFWSMVWEQNTRIICMLTNTFEKGMAKSEQYWPSLEGEEHGISYGDVRVVLARSQTYDAYIMRALQLRDLQTGEKRSIWHLHYTAWPDHGVPDDASAFLDYIGKLQIARRHNPLAIKCPVVVHCSAGVGRSGVLILVELTLALLEVGEVPSLPGLLTELREQRAALVQTPDQFHFAYIVARTALLRRAQPQLSSAAQATTSF